MLLSQFITSAKSLVRSHASLSPSLFTLSRSHFFVSMAGFLLNPLIPGYSFVKKLDRVGGLVTLGEYSVHVVGVIPRGILWPHSFF